MEMTIIQWSKSFGCAGQTKDLHLVVAIAAGFVVIIVIFYGGVKMYGYIEERKEKRIYTGEGK